MQTYPKSTLNGYNAGWCDAAEGREKKNPFDFENKGQTIASHAYNRGYEDVADFRQLHGKDLRRKE
jgi:hypothetical protein